MAKYGDYSRTIGPAQASRRAQRKWFPDRVSRHSGKPARRALFQRDGFSISRGLLLFAASPQYLGWRLLSCHLLRPPKKANRQVSIPVHNTNVFLRSVTPT